MLIMKVTLDVNRCIGKNNEMPFHLKADREHFREVTKKIGKVCVGRHHQKSILEKLGEPLPNRETFVLSKTLKEMRKCTVVKEPGDIITLAQEHDVCVIGGEQVFKLFFPQAQKVFVTHVDACITNGDKYFPLMDPSKWFATPVLEHVEDPWNEVSFRIVEYRRKPRTP